MHLFKRRKINAGRETYFIFKQTKGVFPLAGAKRDTPFKVIIGTAIFHFTLILKLFVVIKRF